MCSDTIVNENMQYYLFGYTILPGKSANSPSGRFGADRREDRISFPCLSGLPLDSFKAQILHSETSKRTVVINNAHKQV